MKKIGILTIHNVNNPGSTLQAYSQANAFQEYFKDADVEIINYISKSKEFQILKLIIFNLLKFKFDAFKEQLIFKDFINKNLPLSKESLFTDDYKKSIEFLRNKYDVIVVGSDELWKTISNKFIRPFPNIYWLSAELQSLKIAFAISANRCEYKDITPDNREKGRMLVEDFDFIGVRDTYTSELIRLLGVKNKQIYKVPDPTFTYKFDNVSGDSLHRKLIKAGLDLNKPILGWVIPVHSSYRDNNKIYHFCKGIHEYYKNIGYQIVSLKGKNRFVDVSLSGKLNPFEWAQVFRYFDFCIATTFHGTVFSLKNQTPFLSIEFADYYRRIKGKIHDLLDDMSLLDNYFYIPDKGNDYDLVEILERAENSFAKADIEKELKKMRYKYFIALEKIEELIRI